LKNTQPTFDLVLNHDEARIPSGALSFDLIIDFLYHQQLEISRKLIVMQDNTILHSFDQKTNIKTQKS
jgi:hypothetical protein